MSERGSTTSKWLIPIGLGVLVVGLVIVALTRGPVELDPDTPEGTVQEYLLALHEGRWDDAVELVHPEWRGTCEGSDLAISGITGFTAELGFTGGFGGDFGGGFVQQTFTEIGSEEFQDLPASSTTVEVTINRGDNGAALGTGWSEYVTFELVDEDDFWWISGDPWPYFIWNCGF